MPRLPSAAPAPGSRRDEPGHGVRNDESAPLIVHVVYRFGVGGLENGIVNLVNGMPRHRWRHAIVALTDVSAEFAQRIERRDVALHRSRQASGPPRAGLPAPVPPVQGACPGDRPHAQPGRARGRRSRVGRRCAGAHPRRARMGHAGSRRQAPALSRSAPALSTVRRSLCRVVAPPGGLSRAAGRALRRRGFRRSTTASTPSAFVRRARGAGRSRAARLASPVSGWSGPSAEWRRSRIR